MSHSLRKHSSFSSLFAAVDVSRGGTSFLLVKRPHRRRARRNGCFRRLDESKHFECKQYDKNFYVQP